MTNAYVIHNGELYHYGVKGMKWGHRKAIKLQGKARTARESAKEWKEIGEHKVAKYMKKGKTDKANALKNKYDSYAKADLEDARRYEAKAKVQQKKGNFSKARSDVSKSRSMGAKVATNILAGAFANRTYNSVIAAGGTKTAARVVTGLTAMGGPLAHVVVSSLYTSAAGEGGLRKRF